MFKLDVEFEEADSNLINDYFKHKNKFYIIMIGIQEQKNFIYILFVHKLASRRYKLKPKKQ